MLEDSRYVWKENHWNESDLQSEIYTNIVIDSCIYVSGNNN